MKPIQFISERPTPEEFSEEGYLAANPDVRLAVLEGRTKSGFAHFMKHGRREGRLQRTPNGPVEDVRKRKLERLLPYLRRDMDYRIEGGRLDFLADKLREEAKIIDVAVASAHDYDPVATSIIDKNPDGLILDCGAGRRDHYYENVINFEIVDYDSTDVLGIGERLPFIDDTFDAVFSIAVLEHVRDPFACAAEISRVLKPGGELYCCVPLLQPVHGYPHHYFNATPQGLRRLFEDEMRLDESATLTPIHPIFSLTWIVSSWAEGLPKHARETFLNTKIGDLLQRPESMTGLDYVNALARETQFELAAATILRATNNKKSEP